MCVNDKLWNLRNTDIYTFLLNYDPTGWIKINSSQIKGVVHDSCIVTYEKGWSWFARGLFSKNPIDLLMSYYELSFKDAVKLLENFDMKETKSIEKSRKQVPTFNKVLPNIELHQSWDKLYFYLCNKRNINKSIVDKTILEKLVYQTTGKYTNICFVNKEKSHWEVIGTGVTRFKRISDGSQYWILPFSSTKCYVCESAIDALSLYELIKEEISSYISIGGSLSRTKLIQKIITEFDEVILAVDNDEAGNKTASLFSQLDRIIPYNKDFNEDLIIAKTQNKKFRYKTTKEGWNYD